jgi:hypothetical protein
MIMHKDAIDRRSFLSTTAAGLALSPAIGRPASATEASAPSAPIGEAKGIFPG